MKSGAGKDFRSLRSPGGLIILNHFGTGDVAGHQVGGELDAFKLEVEDLSECAHKQRLRQAWHTDQHRMALSKEPPGSTTRPLHPGRQ